MEINERLSAELNIPLARLEATVKLLDEGNTVPFVARYRKEVTGGLDDVALRKLTERLAALRGLEKRKEEVLSLIAAQDKLTPEIEAAVAKAETVTEVDDIYRPFRPKRKTRASVARDRGLAPLAALIMEQRRVYEPSLEVEAEAYINEENGVPTAEDALQGARDIIAEDVSDDAELRKLIRRLTFESGSLRSEKAEENPVFEQYYDYAEPLKKIPSHRVLAVNRGEKEGALSVKVEVNGESIVRAVLDKVLTNRTSPAAAHIKAAVRDGYDRLIAPSVERELRGELTDSAGEAAISLFAVNLRHLLMQPPLKGKVVLGFDPGYRTGCKLAVVRPTGAVADTAVIYPTKPKEDIAGSRRVMEGLIRRYGVDVVSIGNGTASGESEMFVADTIRTLGVDTKYAVVSEAGASVYSASELGAEEFPDFDVTERSAVSIARRLQDPLAELVKIDPKSIGVGQYQHDMKPARLDEALTGVVEDCVNAVGVDVNTASYSLLSYIAGINAATAKNIVKYREENGEFKKRKELLKVPRFGAKAFEQAAGFLRIPGGEEIFDNTGVHPESYAAAEKLLALFGRTKKDARGGISLREEAKSYGMKKLADELGIGDATLSDILGELEKPGRDIRDELPPPVLRDRVLNLEDLEEGMVLKGTVRNVVDFGAFVDIGVHQDGLLHISEIADRFIKHPSEVLSAGDVIEVRVKSVDLKRKRIALTRRGLK
ncbi:MAG: RNA-binding transcriptional accessory protein [Clostridia bacterium]|nr:RNA-binding transcriptional accessory protein [Clostridia bacterium]